MKYVLKNGKIFDGEKFNSLDIIIEDDKIIEIDKNLEAEKSYDLEGKIIAPGFVDLHVHLREPGYTHKEDINTGSMAAIRGGYTTICAMANTKPVIDSQKRVDEFNKLVEQKANCQVLTYAAITKNLDGNSEVGALEGICGYSDDGVGILNDEIMTKLFTRLSNTEHLISIHAEDRTLIPKGASINEGTLSEKLGIVGINNASEYEMVKRDLDLLPNKNIKYNLCHVSTKESVELIKKAKEKGFNVSCEVTPHHLTLCEEDINVENITTYKMNPPLRSSLDREELVKALNEGVIDIIATDHAPHTSEEKNRELSKAPFGIIGLEQSFSVLNTNLVSTNKVKLKTILNALTYNPASRINIDKTIAVGKIADLVILDLEKETSISTKYSKARNTPFLNKKSVGEVAMTIYKDKIYDWSDNE